jgi:predicted RNA-binding Zn-ribbon protein involved in translation (DUF1610 family)
MVHVPRAPAALDAWERGRQQTPLERGLTLLALASPGEDPDALAALCIGERDRRLLELREALFGPRLTGLVACPRCGEHVELECETQELRGAPPDDAALVLRGDDHEVRLRLPDSRDLIDIGAGGAAAARTALLERCVISARVGGEATPPSALPPELVAEAGRRLAAADPQADIRFAFDCPACGHGWTAPFDVVPFLWAELDAWAARQLADVHALASAYGWTEPQILALGAARRQSYLRMVQQ